MSLDLQAALVQAYAERLSLQPNPPQPQERSYAAPLSVGAADVLLPPHNRWTFQHMSQLCPTLVVAAGNAPVSDLGPTEDLLQDFTFTSLSGEQVSLQEHLDATFTDGFLVLKKGRVLCERYFNHQAPDTRHIMFSVTKSLTGALAEQLIEQGLLDPDRPAISYVPEFACTAFGTASVRQVMDMAISIDYVEHYEDPNSPTSRLHYTVGLTPVPPGFERSASIHDWLRTFPLKGEHGGFFRYVTATTEAMGWIMERASGLPCHVLFERMWRQLGCERDGFLLADPSGQGVVGFGFNATLRDMGRFGLMLLGRGHFNGHQVLPTAAVERLLKGNDPAVYATNKEFSEWSPQASYKSQWYVFNDHALMAVGIHGQWIFIDFKAEVVIIKQSSAPEAENVIDTDTVHLLKTLAQSLSDA
ncbi:serine hydrolase domain-containing protein [Pseudomonas nitroreducens]|uniref:serine hydrolase domain-containing protein n=1 Tax=Pseudomonas nitroreducens TaxID=46680 RepID=UPI000A051F52|nr:serine hydrolase [Pseudomonas nitroreducens]SNR97507.1 CubicO group peptidase, beta-lactamase class C family [Pseudomonas nitroreducens]